MTFSNTAWAINGPLTSASLARRAEYAATSGKSGIVNIGDLTVSALPTPGQGVQISPGVALILNYYQGTSPNETYVVSNEGVHTVPAADMPNASSSSRSFVLALVVGDPDFSQVGHPWMPSSGVPDGQESTFQYVRPTMIQVSNPPDALSPTWGSNLGYPVLPLALISIPANTTTITQSNIYSLRRLANPRTTGLVTTFAPTAGESMPTGSISNFPVGGFSSVQIPLWAARATVVVLATGIGHISGNVTGYVRAAIGPSMVGESVTFNSDAASDSTRETLVASLNMAVPASYRGTYQSVSFQAMRNGGDANPGNIFVDAGSLITYMINFYEE